MAVAVNKHGKASSDTAANSFATSWTGGGNSGANDCLVVFVSWFNSGGAVTDLTSFTDGTNTYTIAKTLDFGGSGVFAAMGYAKNAAAVATITAHFSSTAPAFFRGLILDASGADTTAPANAVDANFQTGPGTGANAVTSQSGTTATTADGCLVVGGVFDISLDQAPSVGTSPLSFTLQESMTSPDNDGELLETATQTTHGTVAATAKLTTGTDSVGTLMIAIAPPSGGSSANLTAQTATFTEGTASRAVSYTLTGQTATFTEGTISASTGGNVTLSLTGQTGTLTEGALALNIGYALNDGVPLTGQTAIFAEGTPTEGLSYALTAQTGTFTQGALTKSISYGLTARTATLTEGSITASAGGNVNASLSGQTVTSSAGVITASVTYAVTGQTSTSSEGVLTQTLGRTLNAQTATFAEGTITVTQTGNVTRTLTGLSANLVLGVITSSGGVTPKNVMPNLIGLNFSEAQASLQNAGILNLSSIGYFGTFPITPVWVGSLIAPGIVTAQSIAPGTPSVPVNTPITLTMAEFPFGVASP